MRKTDQWVDAALKNALADALRTRADYLTTGSGEMARDMTMGQASGQSEFYDKIVPRRLARLAKKYGAEVEDVAIQTGRGLMKVPGVRLGPELRDRVREQGIPLFSVGGGLYVLGAGNADELGQFEPDA